MSTSNSRPPDQLHGAQQRRPGLSRVWDRMRAAMKRRSSATVATDGGNDHDRLAEFTVTLPRKDENPDATTVTHEIVTASSSSHSLTHATPMPEKFEMLVPDDDAHSDGEEESDQISLPIVCMSNSVNHARAQEMFAKYGLKYEPRFTRTAAEPPAKIRRVQRHVKMHVRWVCHTCDAEFGRDRTCTSCGHERCNRCTRKSRSSSSGSDGRGTGDDQPETSALSQTSVTDKDGSTKAVDDAGALQMTSLEEALREPLEMDVGSANVDDDASNTDEAFLENVRLSLCARPRAGLDAVFKPKTQIIRRICHECNCQILPPNRAECQNCGHRRCTTCPRYPPKPEKWPHGSPGDERPSAEQDDIIMPNVQRVFRKPRQRVRYICERCQTTFMQHDNCERCGHGRCKECVRIPPRRPAHSPAQENLQAAQA